MQVLTVIPIDRGVFKDELTYFTAKAIKPGALVTVLVKERPIDALVIASRPADEVKASLRSAEFSLKKIVAVKCPALLTTAFIEAATRLSAYQAYPLGPVLKSLLPQTILKQADTAGMSHLPESPKPNLKPDQQLLQETDNDRLSFYKSLIRAEFARGASVFLCLPTVADIDQVFSSLGRGIEEYTVPLHNDLAAKNLLANWQRAISQTHPLLIIGTPLFLCLPRLDLKTIIVDRENSAAYKAVTRPFTDYRRLAEYLAAASGARIILGDLLLRVETLFRADRDLLPATAIKQRLVADNRAWLFPSNGEAVISEPMAELLRAIVNNNERTVILTGRRGLAPLVLCDDCGEAVSCRRCARPLALHQTKRLDPTSAINRFICHHCGEQRPAAEKCGRCGGWRLRALGLGSEAIANQLSELFPRAPLLLLDSDHIKTKRQASDLTKRFFDTPGSLLLGTEMLLHHLREPYENALVIGVDSFFALPDFRLTERLFAQLTRLRAGATKRFAIQTRYPDQPLFNQVLKGNLLDFYRQELSDRRDFDYPPFKILIKISRDGDKGVVQRELAKLEQLLKDYQPVVFPALHRPVASHYRGNLLLKWDPATWPDQILGEVLKRLPPTFVVNVDPETIF